MHLVPVIRLVHIIADERIFRIRRDPAISSKQRIPQNSELNDSERRAILEGNASRLFPHRFHPPRNVLLAEMMQALPNSNPRYFFWRGNGDSHTDNNFKPAVLFPLMGLPANQTPNLGILSVIDRLPAFVWYAAADGSIEFLNQRGLAYTGYTLEEIKGWNWRATNILHSDDMDALSQEWNAIIASGKEGEIQARMRRFDGEYRWFLFRVAPLYEPAGSLIGWLGVDLEIDERKRSQDRLQRNELLLAQAQKLSHTGSFGWEVATGNLNWSEETFRIIGCDPATQPTLELVLERVHPDDLSLVKQALQQAALRETKFDIEHRLLMTDGSVKYVRAVGEIVRGQPGTLEYVGAVTDITATKQIEEKLRQDEKELRDVLDAIPVMCSTILPDARVEYFNQRTLDFYGLPAERMVGLNWQEIVHPEDLHRLVSELTTALANGEPLEIEARTRRADGEYRWFINRIVPRYDERGRVTKFYGTAFDIEEKKRAEEKVQQSERELRRIVDFVPSIILVLSRDGKVLFINKACSEYTGASSEEVASMGFGGRLSHPDDVAAYRPIREACLKRGEPFEAEQRLFGKDGNWRWFLFQYSAMKSETGKVERWYVTATDINERRVAEDELKAENLALREEINSTSMFEEILGSSKPMSKLLAEVSKVAATDSTVLILGETGSGKELVARAIHNRSRRSKQAFIRVNCAAIPQALIASELFGHEKGSFTGATQKRIGRFEAANGGTILLDEVGELPAETQVALLRVLQEREIDRVGGDRPVSVDVRVLAATNRDLDAAVREGHFREDLFYRLNVVPIRVPSLRERSDDIPLLVEYFIGRYASRAAKKITRISKSTLHLLQRYEWPGNIRELQNVIERAVILSEGDTFSVDEQWLMQGRSKVEIGAAPVAMGLSRLDVKQEKEMIEAALAASGGRISGPSGAATRLGIPRQTLESKILRLGIKKHQYRP